MYFLADNQNQLLCPSPTSQSKEQKKNAFQGPIHSQSLSEDTSSKPPFTRPPISLTHAFKVLLLNMIPLIVTYLADYLVRNTLFHLIKQKNNIRLTSAIGVGNTLMGVVGLAVVISLNAGLVSKAAQAFGAKNNQLIGFYLHRALIINTIALIPGCCIMYWSDVLFTTLGFDPQFAQDIQGYTSLCVPAIIGLMIFNTLSSYLYSCDIFFPSSVVLILSSIIFTMLSYVLLTKTDMDLGAAALSYSGMQILAASLILLYIIIRDPVPDSFFWFKPQSFKDVWTLFKHEFLVGSMIFVEWIAYEIIYLFAGRLTLVEITSLTIIYVNSQTLYAVPVALADGTLTFIGNAMGEGDINKAKKFLKAALILSLVALVGIELFYITLTRQIVEFYTSDPDTIEKTMQILRIYLLNFPADFIQIVLSSGIRAIGKEKLGSITFLVCFYMIAVPLSYLLCFNAGLRVMGLVYGPMIGLNCLAIWLMFTFWFGVDWEKQKKEVAERIDIDHKALGEEGKANLGVEEDANYTL